MVTAPSVVRNQLPEIITRLMGTSSSQSIHYAKEKSAMNQSMTSPMNQTHEAWACKGVGRKKAYRQYPSSHTCPTIQLPRHCSSCIRALGTIRIPSGSEVVVGREMDGMLPKEMVSHDQEMWYSGYAVRGVRGAMMSLINVMNWSFCGRGR